MVGNWGWWLERMWAVKRPIWVPPVLQVISYYSFLITGQPPALLQVPYYSFSLLQFLITETVIR